MTVAMSQASGSALAGSEATLKELRNVHAPHERIVRARLQPLSRFAGLTALTLCRVFGSRGDPTMTFVLRQLPTSLQVRGTRRFPDWLRSRSLAAKHGRCAVG